MHKKDPIFTNIFIGTELYLHFLLSHGNTINYSCQLNRNDNWNLRVGDKFLLVH